MKFPSISNLLPPLIVGLLFLLSWEFLTRFFNLPPYILPSPILVGQALVTSWSELFPALLITLQVTAWALALAVVSGMAIAILFSQSRWIERSFFPYAVILQTTPIAAIAPLIILWVRQAVPNQNATFISLVICAWIVALFPILSNTTIGLRSTDANLINLFKLYGASRWQTLTTLKLPSALPYFLSGLRISGGLALIGAVVAEFVAGTGGAQAGIAYQILMASYNLQIPRMFAALLLTAGLGILIFVGLTLLSEHLLKHWHESEINDA
jgi:NitT/TauT family transport system permease protein